MSREIVSIVHLDHFTICLLEDCSNACEHALQREPVAAFQQKMALVIDEAVGFYHSRIR